MFWGAGGYRPLCLSIGAPTSPLISNLLMYQFDGVMSNFARANGMVYTRYADDLTLSSAGHLDREVVRNEVAAALAAIDYPKLRLNPSKTKLASKSTSRRVTGLVLANDGSLSIGRERKRRISAMVHHALTGRCDAETLVHLAGLLSFASDVEPTFVDALTRKYGVEAVRALQLRKPR